MQSGKHSLAIVPINLQDCFASLLEMYQEKLEEKRITMSSEGLEKPVWVFGEETGLVFQVLSNLISNAIKFSHTQGHIACRVGRESNFVSVTISDCGIGMSEELKEAIFDNQKPTTRTGTAGEHGTGFGMPIARSYIQRYGGDIRVNSREISTHPDDHGTEFEILLRPALGPDDRWTAPLDAE
jgi:signal transduction histidine kinase